MELRELAESILMGRTLASKLQPFTEWTDSHRKFRGELPHLPQRPPELALNKSLKAKFPTRDEMDSDFARGAVLHFFANHELLAIELMALALLKFPDAPPEFRAGIAQTIQEEQSHLRLYQDRMEELGVGLGEIPVNFFFWNTLQGMRDPMDYVVGMSMTFEQANLDYCLYYQSLMNQVGDKVTAQLLQTVYDDEVGHLKYGVNWFEKLRDPALTQWESYRRSLLRQPPLNPIRAKGIGFDRVGRKRAGLNEEFVDSLELHESIKGNDPIAYWYNADCELELAHGKAGYAPTQGVRMLMRDFETLPMFLARNGDMVFCQRKPSQEYIRYCKQRMEKLPEFVEWNGRIKQLPQAVTGFRFSAFRPWGWTPRSKEVESILGDQSRHFHFSENNLEATKKLYRKDALPRLRSRIQQEFPQYSHLFGPWDISGVLATSLTEVEGQILQNRKDFGLPSVVKSPYGFSGGNVCRIYPEKGISSSQRGWMEKQISSYDRVLVEPWLMKEYDLSLVWNEIDGPLSLNVFLTDKKGRYRGIRMGAVQNKFLAEDMRFFYSTEQGDSTLDAMKKITEFVRKNVKEQGVTGPGGVDFFVHRWPFDNKLYLRCLGELNSRTTMGHIAAVLERTIGKGRNGLWLTLGITDIQAEGFSSIGEFVEYLKAAVENDDQLFFSNDPNQALGAISFLVFSKKLMTWLGQKFDLGISL